jgi:predicted chitinase
VSLLNFNTWHSLNEAIAFDKSANYADKTFGYPVGAVDTTKVFLGGTGSDWGGSMQRALWFARTADDWAKSNGKNGSLISSQKRSRVLTASGNTSDHYKGNNNTYAVDIAASGTEGDALLAYIMEKFGHPEYKGGSWFNITIDGYRYQVGWKVKNHFDHIHVGVKRTIGERIASTVSNMKESLGAKLIKHPKIADWLKKNIPNPVTADQLDGMLKSDPKTFDWFKKTFSINDAGDSIGNTSVDSNLTTSNIKSNYTGEKAANINLLVNEITALGVTNKYAIVGMLSTIGKESGFIPKNEIPYKSTDNARIRKIFGSRVKGLTDDELTALKSNDIKFWDRVYGSDDPTGKSQQYGNNNPGDGAKYLGRGFNGITFKGNYKKYGDAIGMDLVTSPESLNDPAVAAKAAVKFLLNGLKTKGIDPNSFTDKKDAIHAFVQVNAGLGSNIEGSETLANALKVSDNFDLA